MNVRIAGVLGLLGLVAVAVAADSPPQIQRLDQKAQATRPDRYPKEDVPKGQDEFDGAYKSTVQWESGDKKSSVGLWESGPGILQSESYPHDEYCLVLEGTLVVTNRSGTSTEFKAGDSFFIPNGWAGTWDMRTKFKKQFVALPAG